MMEALKVNSFGKADKPLLIDDGMIQYNGKTIKIDQIIGIRYWISSIEFYKFTIGRKFCIGFKTQSDQLDITFRSWFGVGNDYFYGISSKIIDEIWNPVNEQVLNREAEALSKGGVVRFGNCHLSRVGVILVRGGKKEQLQTIGWEDLIYEKKYDRLVIGSKSDHSLFMNLYYEDSWNIEVLMGLLDWITKENGLEVLHS
ncbi:hypothetical protein [Pontibacter sp. H249]|uniref:hypothetical protein n=1 Tax=Pontibacter sp. H249 TaxID=3133420 RepID=UPI0030C44674